MERLWAPWRIKYIKASKSKGCFFCQGAKSKDSHIVIKTKNSLSLLNIFPYNNGHMLIAPRRHVKMLEELKNEEIIDLINTLNKTKKLLDNLLKPQGYNIGLNLGKAAGAGVPAHLHIHLVPRWNGDTNFMPVLANTKVISQSLEDLYKKLKNAQSNPD
ncbi:MAG: HIT domain-containing protein [Candidatus Omnitrophica bacterium]|nr:HIT domain-containing protein [Candidatus Omnitrophota bacterium]